MEASRSLHDMMEQPGIWLFRLLLNGALFFGPLIAWSRWCIRNEGKTAFIQKWNGWICIGLLVGGWLSISGVWALLGENRPGAVFERDEYQVWVWVHAYPKDSEALNYKTPALIYSVRETEKDYDGPSVTYRHYWLRELELPNKKRIIFSEPQALELYSKVSVFTDEGRWDIELTDVTVRGRALPSLRSH